MNRNEEFRTEFNKRGLKIELVSKDLAITQRAVYYYLNDKRDIPEPIWKLFCLIYGVGYMPGQNIYQDENTPDLFEKLL